MDERDCSEVRLRPFSVSLLPPSSPSCWVSTNKYEWIGSRVESSISRHPKASSVGFGIKKRIYIYVNNDYDGDA